MVAQKRPKTSPQLEKLLYFLMLRQMETKSPIVREAYDRLADVASEAAGWDLRTVILDWLETEMRSLRDLKEDTSAAGVELMKAAVSMGNALGQ